MPRANLERVPIFDPEYWGDIQPAETPIERDLPTATQRFTELNDLCLSAAQNVMRARVQPIESGSRLDYDPTNRWIVPGTVLLTDTELLIPQRFHRNRPCASYASEGPEQYGVLLSSQCKNSAVQCFRDNTLSHEGVTFVLPFTRFVCNPAAKLHYVRSVGLAVCAYNKDNEAIVFNKNRWHIGDDILIGGVKRDKKDPTPELSVPTTVGDTYVLPNGTLLRLASAQVAYRGRLDKNRRGKKIRNTRFAGRLVTKPSLS